MVEQNKVEQKAFNLFTPPTVRSIPGQLVASYVPKSFLLFALLYHPHPPFPQHLQFTMVYPPSLPTSNVSLYQRHQRIKAKQNTKKKKMKRKEWKGKERRKERALVLLLLGFCLFGAARKLL